ncbi:MAG: amino acid permease [Flavobacteriaceae bacterium]|nr:amino acid permease [Flavobacteriaceae bacterium]
MAETSEEKKMGLWMSTSLVVGNMVGAGIFLMPAALATYGGISILGWIASAFGALVLAKIFSKLSTLISDKSGGPYAYTHIAFGDFMGFMMAWGYWISIWVSNAAIAIAFVSALTVLFPILGENSLLAVLTGLSAIWFLTWINTKGARSSGTMQLVTTILKIVPITVVIIGGFFFFDIANFSPFNPSEESGFGAFVITASMTLYAYLGIESATVSSWTIRNPEVTIPKATMLGTIITTLLYIFSTVVIMGMISLDKLETSPAPFADAMGIMTGEWGRKVVAAGAAISAFGALNGWILLVGQVPLAAAQDRLFPPVFGKTNKSQTPFLGVLIGSVLTSLVMLMNFTAGLVDQFKFLILLTTVCMLVPYLFTTGAFVVIMMKRKVPKAPWWPIVSLAGIGFIYSLWSIYGTGEKSVFWGFLLLMSGVPLYVWLKWKNIKK